METDELMYCLAKQLARAHTVQTDYGDIALDEEMRDAMEKALRPIIQRRIDDAHTSKKENYRK